MAESRGDRRGFLARLAGWAAALGLPGRQARADDPGPAAEGDGEAGPGPVRQELTGRLTLVQDTSRPDPGGSPHGEALAIVTDGRGIPFAFYERDPDGNPYKVPSTFSDLRPGTPAEAARPNVVRPEFGRGAVGFRRTTRTGQNPSPLRERGK